MNIKEEHAHSFYKKDMNSVFKKMGNSLTGLAKNEMDWNKFKN